MSRRALVIVLLFMLASSVQPALLFAQASAALSGTGLSAGGSGGQPAGGGDLWIDLACSGGASAGIDDPVNVSITLWVEGSGTVANEWFFGWGEASGRATARVRASVQDRYVECDVSGNGFYAQDSATILGSGPGSLDTVVRSFIKYGYVRDPAPGQWNNVFQGDDRSFQAYGGSARTTTVYDVYNPAVNDGDVLSGPNYGTGLSELYDGATSLAWPDGPITPDAQNDWIPGPPMKLDWGFASTDSMWCSAPSRQGPSGGTSTHTFTCVGAVSNPLLTYAPAIDYQFYFTFRYGLDQVEYWITGCHDRFPSFEIYANGQPLLQDDDWGNTAFLAENCGMDIGTRHGFIF